MLTIVICFFIKQLKKYKKIITIQFPIFKHYLKYFFCFSITYVVFMAITNDSTYNASSTKYKRLF